MAKSLSLPATPSSMRASDTAPMPATAAPGAKPAAQRRQSRIAPLLLLACLAIAIVSVLVVPLLVDAAAPAAKSMSVAPVALNATNYETPQQAAEALGLHASLPGTLPEGFGLAATRVLDGQVLELELTDGNSTVLFRAAMGSEDLSGEDYEAYSYTATESVDGITRAYAGVSDKKLNLSVWAFGEYSYALVASKGIDADLMRQIAESVA